MADAPATKSQSYVTIVGEDDENNVARINAGGRLLVAQEPPAAPVGTNSVSVTADSSMSGQVDTTYLITNTKDLTIQRLTAGAESGVSGAKVELYYDPLGTGIGMTLLAKGFLNGSNLQSDLSETFTGNGTKLIRLRRENLDGGNKEIFAKWEGFETI